MGGISYNLVYHSFVLAAVIMFIYLLIKRTNWTVSSLTGGHYFRLRLNFGNILFYIYGQHFKENPTIVFATMDLGVIRLGTLNGATIFKEKISKFNGIGSY